MDNVVKIYYLCGLKIQNKNIQPMSHADLNKIESAIRD